MSQHQEHEVQPKDIAKNKVSTSRYIWYLSVFCIVTMVLGGCYSLYKHRYKGKPDVEVPASSLYTPEYK